MQTAKKNQPSRFWVVQQHDDFKVVEQSDRPETKVEQGERARAVLGPFTTRLEADKRADETYQRTIKGMMEKAGM